MKKYILWNGSDNCYYIFETGEPYVAQYGPPLNCCEILYKYMYDKKTKKLTKTKNISKGNSIGSNNKHLIIYQSDNIQDCIDMIYSIENSLKFNL